MRQQGTNRDGGPEELGDDLAWTAFLYVSGELPAGEAQAFEERLAGDEAAAEAVIRAAELGRVIALAGDGAAARRPAQRTGSLSRALGWMAAGAAVATVVFSLTGFGLGEPEVQEPRTPAARSTAPDSNLVDAWRHLQEQGSWTAPTARWRARTASSDALPELPVAELDEFPTWVSSLEEEQEEE